LGTGSSTVLTTSSATVAQLTPASGIATSVRCGLSPGSARDYITQVAQIAGEAIGRRGDDDTILVLPLRVLLVLLLPSLSCSRRCRGSRSSAVHHPSSGSVNATGAGAVMSGGSGASDVMLPAAGDGSCGTLLRKDQGIAGSGTRTMADSVSRGGGTSCG
jgi:hypothetical protein